MEGRRAVYAFAFAALSGIVLLIVAGDAQPGTPGLKPIEIKFNPESPVDRGRTIQVSSIS